MPLVSQKKGQILLLAVGVILVYGHTLDVPFYFDDRLSIHENTLLRNLDLQGLFHYAPVRIVGYLTLALNYYCHQLRPAGYHLVNILIHFLAGVAVLLLADGLLQTPAMNRHRREQDHTAGAIAYLPLLAGLLFVLHPLQTQAVTYIVQRLASLAAALYLGSLACYVYARLARSTPRQWLLGVGAVLFGFLALFTKQNSATLPLAILLVEAIFFPGNCKRLAIIAAVVLAGSATAYLGLALLYNYDPFSLDAMQALSKETTNLTRQEYLATEATVLWTYIRLFIWPTGQHLDYDILLSRGFGDPVALGSAAAHFLVLAAAVISARRWPLPAFGVLFYYLAHLVESSIIPIRDVVFEHRAYLPDLGLCLLAAWGLLAALARTRHKRVAIPSIIGLVTLLGILTVQRNNVWREPIALWRESVAHSPNKSRPYNELGLALFARGRMDDAVAALIKAVEIGQPNARIHNNLGLVYLRQNRLDQAISEFSRAVELDPGLAQGHTNLGLALQRKGEVRQAIDHYNKALRFKPDNIDARANLARLLQGQGDLGTAIKQYNTLLAAGETSAATHNNMGLALQKQGNLAEAIVHFNKALRLDPDMAEAHNNLGLALGQQGQLQTAIDHFKRALELRPGYAEAHNNLGVAFHQLGQNDLAVSHFQEAVSLDPNHAQARRNLQALRPADTLP